MFGVKELFLRNRFLSSSLKHLRKVSSVRCVLGIESTFDDTAAAVVDENGNILGEALRVQEKEHIVTKGVDPRIAQTLHRKYLPSIVEGAMSNAGVMFQSADTMHNLVYSGDLYVAMRRKHPWKYSHELQDLCAVATATKPGLPFCLIEGLEFTKALIEKHRLPFIPVHHMEAHLLTPRLMFQVEFPFLTLLASGGHCILCVAHALGRYEILGESLDEPPGAAFDKVARALKILEGKQEDRMSSGRDVESLARAGNKSAFELTVPMKKRHDRGCDFSFSGLQHVALQRIRSAHPLTDDVAADIAAWFQHSAVRHIVKQTHRAILFCKEKNFLRSNQPTLVVSGGVTCNEYLRNAIANLCHVTGLSMVTPPMRLCTDNGVMIAWAGMEYLKEGRGVSTNPAEERFNPKAPLGEHIGPEVKKSHLAIPKTNYFIDRCRPP